MSDEYPLLINNRCPWPERRGLRCRLVPKLRHEYPWYGLGEREIVVYVEDDPFMPEGRDWSCVLDRMDISEPLTDAERGAA